MSTKNMRIGEMEAATGVSARLLRYYEERGLLRPERSASGQRLYAPHDEARVRQIRDLLEAGLGTERILDLLPCFDAEPHERTDHLLDSLRSERSDLEQRIESLRHAADALDQLIGEVASPKRKMPLYGQDACRGDLRLT